MRVKHGTCRSIPCGNKLHSTWCTITAHKHGNAENGCGGGEEEEEYSSHSIIQRRVQNDNSAQKQSNN